MITRSTSDKSIVTIFQGHTEFALGCSLAKDIQDASLGSLVRQNLQKPIDDAWLQQFLDMHQRGLVNNIVPGSVH